MYLIYTIINISDLIKAHFFHQSAKININIENFFFKPDISLKCFYLMIISEILRKYKKHVNS